MAIDITRPIADRKTADLSGLLTKLKRQLRRSIKGAALGVLAILFLPAVLMAAKDPEVSERFEGSTGGIFVGAIKEIQDPVYYTSQQQFIEDVTKDRYLNTIALFINEETATYIQTDFTFTVTLRVTYEDLAEQPHTLPDFNLEINYKKGQAQKFDARQYYYFKDARKVKVEIIAIDTHGASWDIKQVLRIENRLVASRDYKFLCTNAAAYDTRTATADELNVQWLYDSDGGATHFDIEWAWIDNDALDKYKSDINLSYQLDARLIFKKNATRVTISKGIVSYAIPLLYDGEGKLFYRIRPVQYRENGDVVEGKWNVVDVIAENDYYDFAGHENNQLNWQASTSFAEEGKRKSVIQYFDGTLRSRQTVTKDNSTPDKNTVVAETYYDYQGRPAVSILPAPTLNTVISYARNFNKFQSIQEYPKDVYDLLDVNQSVCNSNTPPLDNDFGAAKYYSPNNPLSTGTQNSFDKYVPDAYGYPYMETRYTMDGTGRIAEQSGVGPAHKLGSGHQTKYFYGNPDQKELDGLFGTEVGNASHYFKNMVRDANGQYSISYVDMHGRTVATALAGNPPQNLAALPSYNATVQYLTKDLITPQNNLVQGRSIISSTTLLVTSAGQHDFNYSLSPLSAEIIACNPEGQTVCYDCYYDLEIKIADACGTVVREETRRNFTFGNYDQSCINLPPAINVAFSAVLSEGEYNITKTLTVNKDAQDWYRENVFRQKNICKTLQTFINEIYTVLIDGSNCDKLTCATCTTAVGTYTVFRARFLQSLGLPSNTVVPYEDDIKAAWEQSMAHCQLLCDQVVETQLDMIREQMLNDMTPPMGQYARTNVDANQNGVLGEILDNVTPPFHEDGMSRPYNILRPVGYPAPNSITVAAPYYKRPFDESDATTLKDKYKTVNKVIDPLAYEPNGIDVLNDPAEFAEKFDDNWARSLLIYHPEYPKLKYAEANLKNSYVFDAKLEDLEKWDEASNLGYFLDNGARIVNVDPFFSGVGAAYKQTMINFVKTAHRSNSSFWRHAYLGIACLNNNPLCANGVPTALNPSSPLILNRCAADKNNMWQIFKSLYITIKDSIVNAHMGNLVSGITYQNLRTNDYLRRFGNYLDFYAQSGFMTNLVAQVTQPTMPAHPGEQEMLTIYTENCENYIGYWENELEKCDVLQAHPNKVAIMAQITAALQQICIAGSDDSHPFGSSSVRPSSNNNPRRFEDAIEAIFQQHSIPVSALCHPFMIDFPRPYEQQPPLNDDVVVDMHDNCVCEKLTAIKAAMGGFSTPEQMKNYIKSTYGYTIDLTLLSTLLNGCSSTGTCNTYDPPLVVPGWLSDCKPIASNCISCNQYSQLKQAFKTRFTPVFDNVIIASPQSDAEVKQNEAFEDYMNIATGFNKRWQEYLAFETETCQFGNVWDCNRLDSVVDAFRTYSGDTLAGLNCQQEFRQLFNNVFNAAYTYDEIAGIYKSNCQAKLNVCRIKLVKADIFDLAKDFYYDYGEDYWQDTAWQTTFTSYFNQRYDVDYSKASVFAAVSTLCGNGFIVSGQYSAVRLWVLDSTYRTTNYGVAWLADSCERSFTDYFNIQTQSDSLSWVDITALYESQGIALKACAPPVSCTILQQLNTTYNNMGAQACDQVVPGTPDYCRECFTYFINQQLNTDYTYEQVVLMYNRSCGIGLINNSLPACDNIFGCDTLTKFNAEFLDLYADSIANTNCRLFFTEKFNEHFGTVYSFSQVAAIYQLHCQSAPPICQPVAITTEQQIMDVYDAFKVLYPDPAGYFGVNCQSSFTAYFNQQFSTNYTYSEIVNYYIALHDTMPAVCGVANYAALLQFRNDYLHDYGSYTMPVILTNDLFTKLYNNEFQPSPTYTWPDVVNIFAVAGISLNIYSIDNSPVLNCSKLAGVKKAYQVFHSGDEEEKLEQSEKEQNFAALFNLYFNEDRTYSEILFYASDTCDIQEYDPISQKNDNELILGPRDPGTSDATVPLTLCGKMEPHTLPLPPPEEPCDEVQTLALNLAIEQYNAYIIKQYDDFDKRYLEKCLQAKDLETFTVTAPVAEYHYTLYYYDQAGNLVKTVPPEGVHPDFGNTFLNQVKTARANCQAAVPSCVLVAPAHTLKTQYRYNSLNQVIAQISPDGGLSHFWYDRLGRLVISQNAKQAAGNKYSYTLYDDLGRIKEVGEKPNNTAPTQAMTQDDEDLADWIAGGGNNKTQITRTFYDAPAANLQVNPTPLEQKNLRNRVSYTQVLKDEQDPDAPFGHDAATYYSYDIHGNVDKLLQDYRTGLGLNNSGNRFKTMEYEYDLISGKVNKVSYQPGMKDAYYHLYEYDAENKLTEVYTSRDDIYWERDAAYKYYLHGPLARTVLGQQQVQGIDYAYTIQGWLKGVNTITAINGTCTNGELADNLQVFDRAQFGTPSEYKAITSIVFEPGFASNNNDAFVASIDPDGVLCEVPGGYPLGDMGEDGLPGGNVNIGRDAYSFNLNYFDSDYKPISSNATPATPVPLPGGSGVSLFNGNINSMAVNIPQLGTAHLYGYKYDQLNRIVAMDAFTGLNTTNNIWTPITTDNYKERISYDANGNILTYLRNGTTAGGKPQAMDNMGYEYIANTNKLKRVTDAVPANNYTEDIDNQADANNYVYDEIGNLVEDKAEGISAIDWTVYGKIGKITKANNTEINYTYDAGGSRITKDVDGKMTYYVRDASGTVMAVYTKDNAVNSGHLTQTEVHQYGSSRLGLLNSNVDVQDGLLAMGTEGIVTFTRGNKLFELTNHLGNVLATVSDNKLQHDGGSGNVDYYTPDVITATDYYPFGMAMQARTYQAGSSSYRYGFNGKENDNEVKGEGNQQDYGMRIYDPRLGRFLSVDPLTSKYPFYTPYQFAGNSPLMSTDIDGMEPSEEVNENEKGSQSGQWYKKSEGDNLRYEYIRKINQTRENLSNYELIPSDSRTRTIFGKNGNSSITLNDDGTFNVINSAGETINGKSEWNIHLSNGGYFHLRGRNYYTNKAVGPEGALLGAVEWLAGEKIAKVAFKGVSKLFSKLGTRLFTKKVTEQGFKTLAELGIKDGMKVSSSRALELGEQFLGKGYKELVEGSGRYVSADGTRVFRMGASDITGAHGGGPHVNFETLIPNPAKQGKMMVDKNYHVYLTD